MRISIIILQVILTALSVGCSTNGSNQGQPCKKTTVKLETKEITAHEAERLGKDAPKIEIELIYPQYPYVTEYKSGKWRYVIFAFGFRGRSTVHGGTLFFDKKQVINTITNEKISTPFGIMQFRDPHPGTYVQGWFSSQED
jgi:hypothetical protein